MAERSPDRPPPSGGTERPARHGLFRHHRGDEPRSLRKRQDPAYEHSGAAEQERVIVEALGDLRDMDVREVMTPRTDVVALCIPVTERDVVDAVRRSGHSAYPVVHGDVDDLVGVLYVNDLFGSRRPRGTSRGDPELAGLTPYEISRRVRQAHIVPESRPVLAALVEMRTQRRRFAVVVDEHGGVSGVLTVKDLLEPIVGDLHDELDADEGPQIARVDGARWIVDGQTNVDDVRAQLEIEIPDGEYVTLGGFVLDALGHIPAEGETVEVGDWTLTVHEMDKRRIASLIAAHRLEEGRSTDGASGTAADVALGGAPGVARGGATGAGAVGAGADGSGADGSGAVAGAGSAEGAGGPGSAADRSVRSAPPTGVAKEAASGRR